MPEPRRPQAGQTMCLPTEDGQGETWVPIRRVLRQTDQGFVWTVHCPAGEFRWVMWCDRRGGWAASVILIQEEEARRKGVAA